MDDNLRNRLDQLNEEQTSDLLEKDINFDIDKEAIARIKSSVHKKVRTNKKPSVSSRKLIACAAAVILVFCTMFAVGFNNVAAAVKQVIEYIPGFGKVPEDPGRDMLEVKVMKEPVFMEVQGEKVEIYSSWLSIYKDQVIVTAILRYPQNIDLNGEIALEYNGQKIFRDSEFPDFSSLNDKKKNKEMTYTYTIRSPKIPINTLIFKTEGNKVDIAFEKSEDLKDKVISQNFNGIIVSAIPLNQDRSKFILTSTYEKNMEGIMFISSLTTGDSKVKAIDESGNEHEIKQSTSQGSEYYVDGDIKGKIVSLKFNKLYQGFIYENNKFLQGIKFRVPQFGEKVNINKSMDNILCNINLKTVERVAATDKAPYNFMFTYEMKRKIPGLDIFNIALYIEKTGGVMGGSILGKYKEGDSYIVKYGVIADENAADNTVTIIPYPGSYYSNTLLLDKECILKFQ
jgi:hypothetical protein